MTISNLPSSQRISLAEATHSKTNKELDAIDGPYLSSSATLPKCYSYVGRFMTPGTLLEKDGKFGRTTTLGQHTQLLNHPSWDEDTRKFYEFAIKNVQNEIPKEEQDNFTCSIEKLRSKDSDESRAFRHEFPKSNNSNIHQAHEAIQRQVKVKEEHGSERFRSVMTPTLDEFHPTCNGLEEIATNSYENQKKQYDNAIAHLDYEMSQKDFWKSSSQKITKTIQKTHQLLGENYEGDFYPGNFRNKGPFIQYDHEFINIQNLHGTHTAVQRYAGPQENRKDINDIVHFIEGKSPYITSYQLNLMKRFSYHPPEGEQVQQEMKGFVRKLKQAQKDKIDPLDLAIQAHQEFVRIHPFHDGNGRVARIFMQSILMHSKHYPPIFIDKDEYMSSVKNGEAAFKKQVYLGMARSESYYKASALANSERPKPIPTLLDRFSSPKTEGAISYLETSPKPNTNRIFSAVPQVKNFAEIESFSTFQEN